MPPYPFVFLALVVALDQSGARAQTETTLLPSQALHEIHQELAGRGRSAQSAIANQHLARTRTGNLPPAERFALGELYFIAFEPDEADAILATIENGTTVQARIALQRRLRMAMAAYGNYEGIAERIRAARRRLPPIADDPWHFQSSVATLANHLAQRGEHAAVVKVIDEEIAALPVDGVFFSHTLPGEYFASYAAVGREADARAHLKKVLDAQLTAGPRSARGETPPAAPHRDDVVHRLEEGLLRDLGPAETLRFLRGQLVGTLYAYLGGSPARAGLSP